MLTILAPLIVFGLVVFVHELGHFLAAKSVGVYAPRFSIGFGPALFRRRRGETEYIIAALPLGGYVRMASREDEASAWLEGGSEASAGAPPDGHVPVVTANDAPAVLGGEPTARPKDWDPEAMIPFGPKPVPEHRWFESKPLWARLWILIAGVLMNVLLTLAVGIALAAWYGRTTVPTRVVGTVRDVPGVGDLRQALRTGDTVTAVNGTAVATWNDVRRALLRAPADTARVATHRGEVRVPVGPPETEQRLDAVSAIGYFQPTVIDSVMPGGPAARGGVRKRDSIVAVNGAPVATFEELQEKVQALPGREVALDVVRAGAPVRLTMRADSSREQHPVTGKDTTLGRIGIIPVRVARHERIGVGEAFVVGTQVSWAMGGEVLRTLKGLVTRQVSVKQLGGPIQIARTSVEAARGGAEQLLRLIAFLSINVAILNLLPIPVLDGGQILMNLAESIKGGPFSPRTRENILRVGLAAILLLFVTVMWNDIARLIGGAFQ